MGAGIAKLLSDPKNKAVCEKVFKNYDKDKSGRLDGNEFDAFVDDLLHQLGKSDPSLRVSDLDGSFFNKDLSLADMINEAESGGFGDAFRGKLANLNRAIVAALRKVP